MNTFHKILLLFFVAALLLCPTSCKKNKPVTLTTDSSRTLLITIGQIVSDQIQNQSLQLSHKLSAFAKVTASDREFTGKLLVDTMRSVPEVSEAAVRSMEPMGLSVLEITDSLHVLLSCGEFPANAGANVAYKNAYIGEKGLFIVDTLQGKSVLTMQAKVLFKILDAQFYCYGGYIIDENFLSHICAGSDYKVFFKYGPQIIGLQNTDALTATTDSTVVINAKTYCAVSTALSVAGSNDKLQCIVMDEKALSDKK